MAISRVNETELIELEQDVQAIKEKITKYEKVLSEYEVLS